MVKRIGLFVGLFVFFLFINQYDASANDYLNIIDMKELQIENASYIGYLSQSGIYIIDEHGNEIKHFKTQIDSELIKRGNIHFEMVKDVDSKGYRDFLLVIQDAYHVTQSSLILFSYEDETILWEYNLYMDSFNQCSTGNCIQKTYITDYFIDEHSIYVTGGYSLIQIDLTTKDVINQYDYKNNIWSLTRIGDVNNDGVRDFVIAVQTSKIIYIDGKHFTPLNSLKVIAELNVDGIVIGLNIYDLLYKENEQILVALGENGYVYEINPFTNSVIRKEKISTVQEKDLIHYFKNNPSGYQSKNYKNGSLKNVDKNNKYIVLFNDRLFNSSGDSNQFKVCSVKESCVQYPDQQFVAYSNDYLVTIRNTHYDSYNKLRIENMITGEEKIKLSFPNVFYIDDEHYIYITPYVFTYYKDDKEVYTIDIEPLYTSIEFDNFLMVLKGNEEHYNELSIINRQGELVYTYKGKNIIDYSIEDNLLYTVEYYNGEYMIKVIDLHKKNIIKEHTIGHKGEKKLEFIRSYQDQDGDGLKEFLLVYQTIINYEYVVEIEMLNVSKNQITTHSNYINKNPVLFLDILEDLDSDHYQEFLIGNGSFNIDHYYKNHDYYLYVSSSKELYHFEMEVLEYFHYASDLKQIIDLNKDGYKELVFEQVGLKGTKFESRKIILIDFKNDNKMMINKPAENYHKLLNIMDIDHDGKSEIITLSFEVLNSCKNKISCINDEYYKYKINSYSLVDQSMVLLRDVEFFNKNSFHPYLNTFHSVYDYNGDSYMDLIFFDFDAYGQINMNIYDIFHNQLIREKIKVFNQELNHFTDELTRFYNADQKIVTIKGETYFLIKHEKYYLIHAKELSVHYILDDLFVLYSNHIISVDYNHLKVFYPFSLEVTKKIDQHQIIFEFQQLEHIRELKIYINHQLIDMKYNDNTLELILNKGVNHIFIEIYTNDYVYYYSDTISIEKQTNRMSIGIIMFMNSFIMISTGVIRRYYGE